MKKLLVLICLVSFNICTEARDSLLLDTVFILRLKNVSMAVDASVGGRITSLKFFNKEILTDKSVHDRFYGSTLWLSPQGKWRGQRILDVGAYTINKFNNKQLSLTSQRDTVSGFAFKKKFTTSPKDTSFIIKYEIINILKEAQEVSAWEVTRVPTGGLAFYPKGTKEILSKSDLNYQDSIGFVWYPYDSSTLMYQKLFLFGEEGWQAYVHNGVVFIKQFPKLKHNETAPGEENVEIYVNKQKTYIELENQGVYKRLLPQGSLSYEVKWFVRKLPENIKIETGSQELIKYVRRVLKIQSSISLVP